MEIVDIIKKAAGGEKLNEQEKQLLAAFDPAAGEQELASLRKGCELLGSERDQARRELEHIRYQRNIEKLARSEGFADPEYLEFLCQKEQIDPGNTDQTMQFLNRLRENSPRFFKPAITPGAGNPPDAHPAAAVNAATGADSITAMLAEAPCLD